MNIIQIPLCLDCIDTRQTVPPQPLNAAPPFDWREEPPLAEHELPDLQTLINDNSNDTDNAADADGANSWVVPAAVRACVASFDAFRDASDEKSIEVSIL
jgi:hypothetical protein